MVQGSQTVFIKGNRIDQFLHFENLQEEFSTLPFLTSPVELEWLNPTVKNIKRADGPNTRPDWTTLIDQETVDLVNEVYSDDFDITGYPKIENFKEWKEQL